MNIGMYIKNYLRKKNFSLNNLSENLNISCEELQKKLNEDDLNAQELIAIGTILHMDLEQMKLDLKYDNIENERFVYVPIESLSEEELKEKKLVDVKRLKVCKVNDVNEKSEIIPVFEPVIDYKGREVFELKMRQANTIKEVKKDLYNKPIYYSRMRKQDDIFKLEEKYYIPNSKIKFKEIEMKVNRRI